MAASEKHANTGDGDKSIRSYEKSRKMLIITMVIVILIMAAVAFPLYLLQSNPPVAGDGGDGKDYSDIVSAGAEQCLSDNPSLTQGECWDLKYHDTAISEDDPSLCEKITGERIKNSCIKYFG